MGADQAASVSSEPERIQRNYNDASSLAQYDISDESIKQSDINYEPQTAEANDFASPSPQHPSSFANLNVDRMDDAVSFGADRNRFAQMPLAANELLSSTLYDPTSAGFYSEQSMNPTYEPSNIVSSEPDYFPTDASAFCAMPPSSFTSTNPSETKLFRTFETLNTLKSPRDENDAYFNSQNTLTLYDTVSSSAAAVKNIGEELDELVLGGPDVGGSVLTVGEASVPSAFPSSLH